MPELFSLESLLALMALTALEVVLGIDNIVFIAIISGRVTEAKRALARRWGLALAMLTRILLLITLSWSMGLVEPLFGLFGLEFSGRDLILLAGGLFLIVKSTQEVFHLMERPGRDKDRAAGPPVSLGSAVGQIAVLDIIFSLDSVVTAVGMARHLAVMVTAIVIAIIIMMVFAGPVAEFIERHPSFKVLALSFLLLVGVTLTAEGMGQHLSRGYIYFAMAFSLIVELINLKAGARKAAPPAA